MQLNELDLLVPSREPERGYDEASVLGMIVWLWMRSPIHQRTPLFALQNLVLPALKHRQFILGFKDGQPVIFCSWAHFSEEAEERYLDSPKDIRDEDWKSGDRIWMIDWVAPFGHTREIGLFLGTHLWPDDVWHGLRHKPGLAGRDRVIFFYGINRCTDTDRPHTAVPRKTL